MKKIQDLGVNDVVHCPTLEEAERILKMAHGLGLKWSGGDSFLDETNWGFYSERTAYALRSGMYASVDYYEQFGFLIHRASEFFEPGAGLLPEKWAIRIDSREVIDVVGAWLDENYCDNDYNFHASWEFDFMSGNYFVCPKLNLHHIESRVPVGYTQISLEQFKEVYPPKIKNGCVYFEFHWEDTRAECADSAVSMELRTAPGVRARGLSFSQETGDCHQGPSVNMTGGDPEEIKKGDWVYFGDNGWETVAKFDSFDGNQTICRESHTRVYGGPIQFSKIHITFNKPRLATEEELARIRDACKPEIQKGDWVYFGDGWETVMQFNRKDRTLASCGINSYTRYRDGDIEFRENDMTSSPIRLASPEELARIRDAYRPAEFDDLIKELERNFQEPPAAGWKSPVAELAADQWNEALKLAINLLKDKQKV